MVSKKFESKEFGSFPHVMSHKTYAYYNTYRKEEELLNAMKRDIRLAQIWGTNNDALNKIIKSGNDALLKMGASPVRLLGTNMIKRVR